MTVQPPPEPQYEHRIYGTFRVHVAAGAYSIAELELLLENARNLRARTRDHLAAALVPLIEGERV